MGSRFKHRCSEQEMMDDLDCAGETLNRTLKELELINRWLGGNQVTINGMGKLLNALPAQPQQLEIADVGCGGGDMLNLVADWARKSGIKVKLYGVDANPNVIAYARENSKRYPEISYEALNIFSQEFQQRQVDIIICTLFTHHFDDQQLEKLFRAMQKQARLGVVINDLHRHWIAYWTILMITRYFSNSAMVRNDAPISVKRGFTRSELLKLMAKSSVKHYQINWRWAFRWQLIFWH
jgi:2-polyprenyl-3-methyl-5-hydroxy-6-metoxy-1,4-benzoquinol methylase